MIAKSRSRQPRAAKTAQSTDIEDRIRYRAYQLYEQRGTVDGFALDDWLQAQADVWKAQKQPKVKSAKAAESRSRMAERA